MDRGCYLAIVRPPVREICLAALEDLYRNYDDAKVAAGKLLKKIKPQVLEPDNPPALPTPPLNSIKSPTPLPPSDSKEGLPSASATAEGVPATPNAVAAAG
ncbi:MAG: hypothetical protein Q9222_001993 [Ikaeria aurantiellina]